ncbi:MAG: hypothetical protein WBA63_10105 [Thermomicrobiales bacterium]
MNLPNIDLESQLRLAQARREAQIHRSQVRAYLAATQNRQSFTFRFRRGASRFLFTMAGAIKPPPSKQDTAGLWVQKRLSAS